MPGRRRDSPKPIYQQIADYLRERIENGTLAPGDQLPTEKDLTEQFHATRATIRQGLTVLVNEGLVLPARPRGHFVRRIERSIHRPQSEWRKQPAFPEADRWVSEQTTLGLEPRQTIAVEIVAAPQTVAKRLDLEPDELVVLRRRTRYLDGEPFNINDSYYPRDVVEGSEIMNPVDVPRGTNQVLTDLGYDQVRALDEIDARMPHPDEVTRLELSPGTPVLVHRVTGYDKHDRPIRHTLNVLAGNKHVILFEREKSNA